MERQDQEQLIRLVLNHGRIGEEEFDYDTDYRKEFARRYGLESLFDRYDRVTEQDEDLGERIEAEVERRAREELRRAGVDTDRVFGQPLSARERAESLLDQLAEAGIDRDLAEELGLDNLTVLSEDGVIIGMNVNDTPKNRATLEDNDIEYAKAGDKLRVRLHVEAREGVSFDNTAEVRRVLDENEMDYIRMAEGQRLFVPSNWHNMKYPYTNSQLVKNTLRLAGLAAFGILNPVAAVLVIVTLKKLGVVKHLLLHDQEITSFERKALMEGLTVYKNDPKKGERYFYLNEGNLCSMNARDVPIPRRLHGIPLTPEQREQLRTGRLLTLHDQKGDELLFRIDVREPTGVTEYTRGENRKTERAPKPSDDDREILKFIKKRGIDGIISVFGEKKLNLTRDTFLSKYGMRTDWLVAMNASGEERDAADRAIREAASSALDNLRTQRMNR
jgi:hypothetical protein